MKAKQPVVPILVTIGLAVAVVAALYIAASRTLTSTESVLLGIMLSVASMLVSWLVTHLYSQANLEATIKQATAAHGENVRNYARKAAEKVLNLSNELGRLIAALRAAIEDTEELSGYKETSALLQERISSAVHNLETLRSMNDTFLSDWRGVIGEEIERQHALESQINELAAELAKQRTDRDLADAEFVASTDLASLESSIKETESRLLHMIRDLPFKVAVPAAKPKKQEVAIECPNCGKANLVGIRQKARSRKMFTCGECGTYAEVRQLEDGVREVVEVGAYKFNVTCPVCAVQIVDELPDYASALKRAECEKCGFPLLLSRSPVGVNVKVCTGRRRRAPQVMVDRILAQLPARLCLKTFGFADPCHSRHGGRRDETS